MRDLSHFRPDYTIAGASGPDAPRCDDAHRVVRNAVAVARILPVSIANYAAAEDAVVRVENQHEDDRVYTVRETAALAEMLGQVIAALAAAIDDEGRPVGPGGARIIAEAGEPPDVDRVFALDGDGRVLFVPGRPSLSGIRERLAEVRDLLAGAAARGDAVALVE
jgi:hypothetical protein